MDEEAIIRNLRHMAWERAKGELRSMLHTFWNDAEQHEGLSAATSAFIKEVEDNGLHE